MAIVKTYDSKLPSWKLWFIKPGTFLETVKLIAEYNPVMNEHLSDIQVSKKRMSTYLSQTTQYRLI